MYLPSLEKYRYLIKHLVLKSNDELMKDHVEDWHWPLKVDFRETLPNLETLYLDFRAGLRQRVRGTLQCLLRMEKLIMGYRSTSGMKLKKLVLVGLCSHLYGRGEHWERMTRILFEPALKVGGEFVLLDEDYIW